MFKPCFEHTEHFVSAGDPHRMHTFLIGSPIFSGPDGEGAPARDAGAAAPESRAVVFVDMTGEWIRGAPRARRVSRATKNMPRTRSVPIWWWALALPLASGGDGPERGGGAGARFRTPPSASMTAPTRARRVPHVLRPRRCTSRPLRARARVCVCRASSTLWTPIRRWKPSPQCTRCVCSPTPPVARARWLCGSACAWLWPRVRTTYWSFWLF